MIVVPMLTWPILTLSIVLILTSVVLAMFVLLHKGRGGGMSDLFGGGMSTSMGGSSGAGGTLDRRTVRVGLGWVGANYRLWWVERFFPDFGTL